MLSTCVHTYIRTCVDPSGSQLNKLSLIKPVLGMYSRMYVCKSV